MSVCVWKKTFPACAGHTCSALILGWSCVKALKALSEGGAALLREGLGGQGVWGRVGLPLGYSPPQAKLSAC